MTEGPCCAHQRVNLTPHIHEDGNRTDYWRCDCGQVFMPVGSPLAETETAARTRVSIIPQASSPAHDPLTCDRCGKRGSVDDMETTTGDGWKLDLCEHCSHAERRHDR